MTEAQFMGRQFGSYRLMQLLGSGGQAEVYLGEHVHLLDKAAVKVFSTHIAQEDSRTFAREAHAFARLDHPHIVRVRDFGVEETLPYLVMDYAPQGSLRTRHPAGTQLSLEAVYEYVEQLAGALQYIHEQKLIHGNLKPANILLDRNGGLLLADFALTTIAQHSQAREDSDSIAYMAPEQLQGKPQPASDLYAFGVMIYEWLSGTRPFQGTFSEIVNQQLNTPPLSLRARRPDLPSDLEQVLTIALAREPSARFASVKAFATAFKVASGKPGRGTQIPVEAEGSAPASTAGETPIAPSGAYSTLPDPAGWSHPLPVFPPDPGSGGFSQTGQPQPNFPGAGYAGTGALGPGYTPIQSQGNQGSGIAGSGGQQAYGFPSTPNPTPPLRNLAQEQLRFTAFHPQTAPVETWNTLLVYAYVESALRAVQADAARFKAQLGSDPFKADAWAAQPLTRGTEITVLPLFQGISFNPERITFTWTHDWHPAIFSFGADRNWIGRVASGDILILAGPMVIAALRISLLFGAQNFQDNRVQAEASASRYRKIFTSYSHADTSIVQALRRASQALGDTSFLDVENLRSGQAWNAALLRAIDGADVFQLFWSKHSAQSQYVAQEYHYALQHYKYEGFIRPVYWQKPMAPPPPELSHLHFAYYEMPRKRFGLFSALRRG